MHKRTLNERQTSVKQASNEYCIIQNPACSTAWQALHGCSVLENGGLGLRFEIQAGARPLPAFVIRHEDVLHAYLNQCPHVAMEMDWQAGQFFDAEQRTLMCATHGARFEPSTGQCVDGPCLGQSLTRIALREHNGTHYAAHLA